jgi:hypothetical protein
MRAEVVLVIWTTHLEQIFRSGLPLAGIVVQELRHFCRYSAEDSLRETRRGLQRGLRKPSRMPAAALGRTAAARLPLIQQANDDFEFDWLSVVMVEAGG